MKMPNSLRFTHYELRITNDANALNSPQNGIN
jgi:hypothetical protein